ncbi:MAG: TldD/PmbA family protein, partial [Thermodesulfobacteriota bacterium]|nr:TldD/PmbA family protein [Thermodesulfobacteriota bacterium]
KIKRATYAEVRSVRASTQLITVKNGNVEVLSEKESEGFGVRVIADNAWGFASTSRFFPDEADMASALAVQIAKASALSKGKGIEVESRPALTAHYKTPLIIDPLSISADEKIALLLKTSYEMQKKKEITVARGTIMTQKEEKLFANTEGTLIEQEIVKTGCGIGVTAVSGGDVQRRSYPSSMGHQGTEGWEFVLKQNLVEHGARIAEEAVALLSAKPCPSAVKTIILDGSQLALQLHESCGHAIELDRVLGSEAAYAGTSFLTLEKQGQFRYGSEIVNIDADATYPGGLGTFGYDDEGVAACNIPIVKDGIFVGYLTSRETAPLLGASSNGTMRASSWNRIPLIRMTNVNLRPGNIGFDELIESTDDGIYMETNKSWSIDDRRINFQFGTEIAWEVKQGKLGKMLKNPTYTGMTPQFWSSCDAICNNDHYSMWGISNCAKGQPMQVIGVGHGTAPARFRGVQVGVMN